MKERIIGFNNGNKIIDTNNSEKLRGLNFDYLYVWCDE